jgi:predicted N-acyltransferase
MNARAGATIPKLQAAVPFTPATGRRFLGPDRRAPLAEAAIRLAEGNALSSLHVTFCTADETADLAGHAGLLPRLTASSSTGKTAAMPTSAISSPICPAASAR